ncbi:hypothetical protein ACIQ62_05700 [Streptomyces sp. NPDC096319]|uniref:hypothetical protein n=1 Tax=Streptomyces sp. NPDC096319 TaxID=3366084 RepID=UPI0037FA383C
MPQSAEVRQAMTRAATTAVCERGERYRPFLVSRIGDADPLDRAIDALRTGADPVAALDELDAALQASGDPHGLYGALRGVHDPSTATGIEPSAAGESVYLCPTDRCSRFWLPDDVSPTERCALSEAPLRRRKL